MAGRGNEEKNRIGIRKIENTETNHFKVRYYYYLEIQDIT